MTTTSITHVAYDPAHHQALEPFKPFDLNGLKTYDLTARPSKVFHDDLGLPVTPDTTVEQWLGSLPKQLAAVELRRVSSHLCRAHRDGRTAAAAVGGHVIKTGCAPYLIDWIQRGLLRAIAAFSPAATIRPGLSISERRSSLWAAAYSRITFRVPSSDMPSAMTISRQSWG